MKFLILLKSTKDREAGQTPSEALIARATKFNEECIKAGILLHGENILPSTKAKRLQFSGKGGEEDTHIEVVDGPFGNPGELVAGYWMWQLDSIEEAEKWAKRIPYDGTYGTIEIRPVASLDDLGDGMTPELAAKLKDLRAQVESK